ncbi:MAG: phosphoglucosamine mutase [bacterium]|nr:phosphoglucosamine mutase [bacterium]MDE0501289.1 phosphoglucosamine mutase [bacterium]
MASAKNLFGTDGIRGIAGRDLTAGLAFGVGRAAGASAGDGRVLVGMDTRPSGPELSYALRCGLQEAGVEPVDLGVIPAGGISHLTAAAGAAMGVVVSASHNPAPYNGIKLLGPDGAKLPDDVEAEISEAVRPADNEWFPPRGGASPGSEWPEGIDVYLDWLAGSVSADLSGLSVVVDCANGAAFRAAPGVLRSVGVETVTTAACSDGSNINHRCGATHPEWVGSLSEGRIGLALDGDADRLIAVDETGAIVDGDFLMAILARHLQRDGRLRPPLVVATVMSNLGFNLAMASRGIETALTKVGDRYVREEMIRREAVLGGEQSGHIIFGDLAVTGDGLLTALQLLEVVALSGRRLADLRSEAMERFPQVLVNVEVDRPREVEGIPEVWEAVARVERELGETGRVLVRPSGTEPLVRVMIECRESELAERYAQDLAGVIAAAMDCPAMERE